MSDPPNQPKNTDAVLGGQTPTPNSGAVLSGLAGVKHRLNSKVPELRQAGIKEAIQYGNAGLELVIEKGVETWNAWRAKVLCLYV